MLRLNTFVTRLGLRWVLRLLLFVLVRSLLLAALVLSLLHEFRIVLEKQLVDIFYVDFGLDLQIIDVCIHLKGFFDRVDEQIIGLWRLLLHLLQHGSYLFLNHCKKLSKALLLGRIMFCIFELQI